MFNNDWLTSKEEEMLKNIKEKGITKKEVRAWKKGAAKLVANQLGIREEYARKEYVNDIMFFKELEKIAK